MELKDSAKTLIKNIRGELKRNADPEIKESGERFFKEAVKMYGFKTAAVEKLAKNYFQDIKYKSKGEIFGICEEFWKSGYMEESFIACRWSYNLRKSFDPGDFSVFEKWVNKYVSNWAACDTLCNHTVGTFVEMYPAYVKELKKWARSKNRWVRRASAVSFIVPAKRGKFLKDVFEIADILLLDADDMVQKGYGWALKAASQSHQQEVFKYVMKNKKNMPRTALRYAIEKMPKNLKAKAMLK